jgi:4-hydroxythreonine-4-phosphate dehydrogenase
MPLKPIAISLGDPAGIGGEVAAKALMARPSLLKRAWLFGDPQALPARYRTRLSRCRWTLVEAQGWRTGRPSAASGRVAYESVVGAALACLEGSASALVTAPLSKEALHLAGHRYPGHTELLAELAGLRPQDVGMLLVGGGLRVFLVTRHLSLRQALDGLSTKALNEALAICAEGLAAAFKIKKPRLALAALNPHAGEAGAFGTEEQRLLSPFVAGHKRARGFQLSGPYPADTVFVQALRGSFDAVLCLYHDQALIPLKLLAFESGINVTLGLPFVRTSPDHGTAYDIAGKDKAHPGSFLAALDLAAKLGA